MNSMNIDIVCKCGKQFVFIASAPPNHNLFNWRMGTLIPCPWCEELNYKRWGNQVGKGFIVDAI